MKFKSSTFQLTMTIFIADTTQDEWLVTVLMSHIHYRRDHMEEGKCDWNDDDGLTWIHCPVRSFKSFSTVSHVTLESHKHGVATQCHHFFVIGVAYLGELWTWVICPRVDL